MFQALGLALSMESLMARNGGHKDEFAPFISSFCSLKDLDRDLHRVNGG